MTPALRSLSLALLAASTLLGSLQPAATADPLPAVEGLRPLLEAAQDRGEARARIAGGPLPGLFAAFHGANGALVAEAERLETLGSDDCARYAVSFIQRGALAEDGSRTDAPSLRIELNWCLDGSAPSGAIDLDLFGELLSGRGAGISRPPPGAEDSRPANGN